MPAPATTGRGLYTLVGLTTAIGGYIADWNHTHVFNDRWPPHAKFHNGQTMSMGLCLGLSTLYYVWRPNPNITAEKDALRISTWLASMYWITQMSAILYPGSRATDPEFGDGFPQAYLCAGLGLIIWGGYYLESGRIMEMEKRKA
ncbi:hypothetical protein BP6252_00519 [Coleophoma cylindrospora]|uniref:Uncharacterized protein n=1 Tax=Coleophoma cylindrospora TaxID=1849047 RepID=A0A3D8SQB1_9HELO|nr:hypothetical protein BP6252_00519 [Coleophoma cylindrospora]